MFNNSDWKMFLVILSSQYKIKRYRPVGHRCMSIQHRHKYKMYKKNVSALKSSWPHFCIPTFASSNRTSDIGRKQWLAKHSANFTVNYRPPPLYSKAVKLTALCMVMMTLVLILPGPDSLVLASECTAVRSASSLISDAILPLSAMLRLRFCIQLSFFLLTKVYGPQVWPHLRLAVFSFSQVWRFCSCQPLLFSEQDRGFPIKTFKNRLHCFLLRLVAEVVHAATRAHLRMQLHMSVGKGRPCPPPPCHIEFDIFLLNF